MKIQGVQVQLYFHNFKYIYSNKYNCTYDTNIKIETILYDDLHLSEVNSLFCPKTNFDQLYQLGASTVNQTMIFKNTRSYITVYCEFHWRGL